MESLGHNWANRIGVVIVAFNSAAVIGRALSSLPAGVQVVVVDNASTDGSADIAAATDAFCLKNRKNLGFGRASNQGAAYCAREFILFLNPDAMLTAGALHRMLATAVRNPEAAAVGPRLIDETGRATWRFASILHPMPRRREAAPVEPEGACCIPLLTGAALLCRAEAFRKVGGFDENIFLYHEDDDLSLRFTRAGYSLIYEPAARVVHEFGRSSEATPAMVRFKAAQRLLSQAYICGQYGLPFDCRRETRRALKRLLIAGIISDRDRRSAALGRLDALREIRARWTLPVLAGAPLDASGRNLIGPPHPFDRAGHV